jgi:arginine exporter protein ArgO
MMLVCALPLSNQSTELLGREILYVFLFSWNVWGGLILGFFARIGEHNIIESQEYILIAMASVLSCFAALMILDKVSLINSIIEKVNNNRARIFIQTTISIIVFSLLAFLAKTLTTTYAPTFLLYLYFGFSIKAFILFIKRYKASKFWNKQ